MLLYAHFEQLTRSRQADLWLEAKHARLVASVAPVVPSPGTRLTNLLRRLGGATRWDRSVALDRQPNAAHPTGFIWRPSDSPVPPMRGYPWGPPI
jgi:hypothetical protein